MGNEESSELRAARREEFTAQRDWQRAQQEKREWDQGREARLKEGPHRAAAERETSQMRDREVAEAQKKYDQAVKNRQAVEKQEREAKQRERENSREDRRSDDRHDRREQEKKNDRNQDRRQQQVRHEHKKEHDRER